MKRHFLKLVIIGAYLSLFLLMGAKCDQEGAPTSGGAPAGGTASGASNNASGDVINTDISAAPTSVETLREPAEVLAVRLRDNFFTRQIEELESKYNKSVKDLT